MRWIVVLIVLLLSNLSVQVSWGTSGFRSGVLMLVMGEQTSSEGPRSYNIAMPLLAGRLALTLRSF